MAAICVFCASSTTLEQQWLDLAYDTGRELAARGHSLVSGGGRVGMMGTVAEGARAGGARTYGVIPQTLVDWEVADTSADELVVTDDMGARKTVMIERADAFVTLPGGLGTLDELFEVWTTATLGVHAKPIVLVDPDGFYEGLLAWLGKLADTEFVRRPALEMIHVVSTVPAALDTIETLLATTGPRISTDRSRAHVDRFNTAVTSGHWTEVLAGFAPDAVMTFHGRQAGPYAGVEAIADAYRTNPPTEMMTITSMEAGPEVDHVRFRWSSGDTGRLSLQWDDAGRVRRLDVEFD